VHSYKHQVYMCIHLTKVKKLLLWLMCFLWLQSVQDHSNGASVVPNLEICVSESSVTNPTKLNGMDL
jgi:hypothetical protein